jgi:cytoskeleton protein RodZ
MPPFGENLRREREMRGVTLEEISEATKISIRFLEAMENEAFSKLPGGIFTRSFIRTYARYLGLDEERVLGEYQLAAQPGTDVDIRRMGGGESASHRPSSRTPLIVLLVAAALLVGGYALFRYSRRAAEIPANPSGPQAANTQPAVSQPQGSIAPPPSSNLSTAASPSPAGQAPGSAQEIQPASGAGTAPPVNEPGVVPKEPATPPPSKPAGSESGLVLQVAATERAWVEVKADGKSIFQRALNPNEVQTFKAQESFNVTTGNAQGVILSLNGETLKPLGRQGEVKSVRLTREDLKKPAP